MLLFLQFFALVCLIIIGLNFMNKQIPEILVEKVFELVYLEFLLTIYITNHIMLNQYITL